MHGHTVDEGGIDIESIEVEEPSSTKTGVVLSPAMGAVLMSISTVIVAVNARFLRLTR